MGTKFICLHSYYSHYFLMNCETLEGLVVTDRKLRKLNVMFNSGILRYNNALLTYQMVKDGYGFVLKESNSVLYVGYNGALSVNGQIFSVSKDSVPSKLVWVSRKPDGVFSFMFLCHDKNLCLIVRFKPGFGFFAGWEPWNAKPYLKDDVMGYTPCPVWGAKEVLMLGMEV